MGLNPTNETCCVLVHDTCSLLFSTGSTQACELVGLNPTIDMCCVLEHDTLASLFSTCSTQKNSADSRRVVVSYKLKYVHKVPVNHFVEFAQEKVWLGELTVPP